MYLLIHSLTASLIHSFFYIMYPSSPPPLYIFRTLAPAAIEPHRSVRVLEHGERQLRSADISMLYSDLRCAILLLSSILKLEASALHRLGFGEHGEPIVRLVVSWDEMGEDELRKWMDGGGWGRWVGGEGSYG